MPKSKVFHVKEGRMFFKCPVCQYRRVVAVSANQRRRSVLCRGCGQKISCVFNRRHVERASQSGRVLLLVGGIQTEVNLFDISGTGVGFELDARAGIKLSVGREIEFKCSWNPRLFSQGRYVVKSMRGLRVGAELRR